MQSNTAGLKAYRHAWIVAKQVCVIIWVKYAAGVQRKRATSQEREAPFGPFRFLITAPPFRGEHTIPNKVFRPA